MGYDPVLTSLAVVAVIAMIGVAGFGFWDRHTMCQADIEGSLLRYHATDIKMRLDWMDFTRDSFSYDVQYRDRTGKVHYNRCKVTTSQYLDPTVYWDDPIEPPATRLTSQPEVARRENSDRVTE